MPVQKRQVLLNRAVFNRRALQVNALPVLTTLIHRFPDAGSYELFVFRDGSLIHRAPVQVVDGGVFQININLAGAMDERFVIAPGGALGFFAGSGLAAYSVRVDRVSGKERVTVLDSTNGVPAGDLFAVTLVRPGRYRVTDAANKIDGVVVVDMPPTPKFVRQPGVAATPPRQRYRTDQPTAVTIAPGEMKPKEVRILAGQTVVFQCTVASSLRVEPLESPPAAPSGAQTAERQKMRRTFPKTTK